MEVREKQREPVVGDQIGHGQDPSGAKDNYRGKGKSGSFVSFSSNRIFRLILFFILFI